MSSEMVRKFACILLTVGVAALLCGRSQIRQRDASELQGWLTENGYQDLADIFLDEGILSKAHVLALKGTAMLQHREMPERLKDRVTEAVHVLWEHCEFEVWFFSHNLLDCHENFETLQVHNFSTLSKFLEKEKDLYSACPNESGDQSRLKKAVATFRSKMKRRRAVVDQEDVLRYFRHKNYPSSFAVSSLQWGTADAEVQDPSVENPELKGSPFKA